MVFHRQSIGMDAAETAENTMSINGILVVDSVVHGFNTTASNAISRFGTAALPPRRRWSSGNSAAARPARDRAPSPTGSRPEQLLAAAGQRELAEDARVAALPWCRDVAIEICPADRLWDPSRLKAARP